MLRGVSRLLFSPSVFNSNSTAGSIPFHTTSRNPAQTESPQLDESYQQLLDDVNFSLKLHQKYTLNAENTPLSDGKDSETTSTDNSLMDAENGASEPVKSTRWKRKSAEARFGSDRIGQVKLPFELVSSMQLLIDGKHGIHVLNKLSNSNRNRQVPAKI
jgi:hypothetical protein